jgi:iron complex outermembrane receptor protein
MVWANHLEGTSWSVEGFASVQAAEHWRLRGGYSHFVREIKPTSTAVVPFSELLEGADPRNSGSLQSILDLPRGFQVDLVARYVDPLPRSLIMAKVPAYTSLDARLGWQRNHVEVSVSGQNLLDDRHPEFLNLIERSVFGKITWRD